MRNIGIPAPQTPLLDRRTFLRGAALASLPLMLPPGVNGEASPPGLIIREKDPENLEFPFPSLDGFLTPAERFYVRNHFAAPKLDAKAWRLKVEGAVERPLEIDYDALRKLPSRTATAVLECAGNSRVFLTPKAKGVAWELGAVGNAEWTGVPLAAVLERAGLKKEAVEVVLEGADSGEVKDEPKSPGVIHFARSLSAAKARQPEVLLAYQMNGKDLPAAHGFPVRAVVPGWYGVASVKWLTRVVATEKPFTGYYQTMDYTCWERRHGLPTLVPITELEVKAEIARPAFHEVVPKGKAYRVHGAAWTGETEVTKVEVSADGGRTWGAAKLLDKPVRHAWRLWEFDWRVPDAAGRVTLLARAADKAGRVQPMERDPDRRNYLVSHVLPIEVEVR